MSARVTSVQKCSPCESVSRARVLGKLGHSTRELDKRGRRTCEGIEQVRTFYVQGCWTSEGFVLARVFNKRGCRTCKLDEQRLVRALCMRGC